MGLPGGSDGKASACNEGDEGRIRGSGRPPGEGHGYPLQCSCLENARTEDPGGPQSMGPQRAGHDLGDEVHTQRARTASAPGKGVLLKEERHRCPGREVLHLYFNTDTFSFWSGHPVLDRSKQTSSGRLIGNRQAAFLSIKFKLNQNERLAP